VQTYSRSNFLIMIGTAGLVDSKAPLSFRSQVGEWIGVRFWRPGTDRGGLLAGILVFIGYYFGVKLGLALTFQPHPVSVMWPPNSILLAGLLLTPFRRWWVVLLCALPAHLLAELQSHVPLRMVICWFVSNSSEALIGAGGTRLLIGASGRFDSVRSLAALFLCAGMLAPVLSSFLDAAFVALNHFGHQGYWQVLRMRLFSNVFAEVTIVPAIVTCGAIRCFASGARLTRTVIEAGLLFLCLVVVSARVFLWEEVGTATNPTLMYAPLPFLLWAAVRFGPVGTSNTILLVAFMSIWGAVHGRGPFTSRLPEENAIAIQAFFLVATTLLMFLAASISERRKAEERFAKVFRSSPDAMIVSHLEDGNIIEVNGRWEKMFGYQRGETIGRTVFDLKIFASDSDREKLTAGTAIGDPVHDLELCLRARTGELRYAQLSADTDEIGGKRCLITIIRDISDRKRAEEAQQNLAHLSRLAVMGEMTAMVAHEVNQPLGAILSNAEAAEILLESKEPKLDEVRQILSEIRNDDLRADGAIRRIRALLSKREFQLEPLRLDETLTDVVRMLASDALRRRVQICKEVQPQLPLVLGDRLQLEQVLFNLIFNGMDAMNDTPASHRKLTLKAEANEPGVVRVTIMDCGHGIPADRRDRIFESFFTTKKDGMGLGLSIARSIVEAHHGKLWFESNPRGGATFHFTVQAAKAEPERRSGMV
jgi:PAS domain S-box-containing protein